MQSLGALTIDDFLTPVTVPLIKLEVYMGNFSPYAGWTKYDTAPPGKRYSADITSTDDLQYGGGWVDCKYVLGVDEKLLEEIAYSLAGANLTPEPIAGTWSARIFNKDAVFFPRHPTSSYTTVFQVGRPVRLSIGLKKNGVDYFFQQIIGVIAKSDFTGVTLEVDASGFDYMQVLSDTAMKSPNNYWGATVTKSTAAGVYRYAMPADCTGIYISYWCGAEIYNGNDWTYDAVTNEFVFNADKTILNGVNNLIIYYFQLQTPENMVADILVLAGLYADRASALAAMSYTATGITIRHAFFPARNSAIYSINQICERCNYRFYFKYDGSPVFKPFPAAKNPGSEDLVLLHHQQANYKFFLNDDELFNRIVIEGEEQASPIWKQNTQPNKYRGEVSSTMYIKQIGEKTLPISNHLFQDQAAIATLGAAYLAIYTTEKNYFSFDMIGCPLPVELWDTARIQHRLTPPAGRGKKYGTAKYLALDWRRLIPETGTPVTVHAFTDLGAGIILAGTADPIGGEILRSVNYGATWSNLGQQYGETKITALAALGGGIAVAGTYPTGKILRSTDSGATWTDLGQQYGETWITSLTNLGGGIAIAGTGSGLILRSTDSGATWTNLGSPHGLGHVYSLLSLGGGIVLAGTAGFLNPYMMRSVDSGATWTNLGPICADQGAIFSLADLGGGIVLAGLGTLGGATTATGRIIRSTDYGLTWNDLGQQFGETYIQSLAYLGGDIAVAGTRPSGKILRSADAGLTWSDLDPKFRGRAGNVNNTTDEEIVDALISLGSGAALAGTSWCGMIVLSEDYGASWTSGNKYESNGIVISQRGLVRDIKVNKFTNTIICQEVT